MVFRKDRPVTAEKSRGGGVAILCSPLLHPILIQTYSCDGIESLVIDIHLPSLIPSHSLRSVRICLVYRSPSCSSPSLDSFLFFIQPLINDSPFIICGDLNFPSIDWSSLTSPTQNDFLSFTSDYHLTQFVHFKTRGENILDLVFCNKPIIKNVTPCFPFADHVSISFSLNLLSPPSRKLAPSRQYHLADWESINSIISSHDWTFALSPLDANSAFNYFNDFVNSVLDTFIPKSTPSPSSRYPKHLRILYGKSQRASSLAPNSVYAFTLAQRFERTLRAHSVRVESRVVDSKSPKLFYTLCKSRLTSSNSTPPGIIDLDGSHLLSDSDKALAFSKYFASVSTLPLHGPLPLPTPSPIIPLFDLPSISPEHVLSAIQSLVPKCNLSPDGLPNIFYCKCKVSVVSPLLIIFNKSLLTKTIPEIWKKAIVKPIPKTSSNSISTFRPISLTCSVTKILEKILISEITAYLDVNNLFDFHQAGFRINRSTCTQLVQTHSDYLLFKSKNSSFDTIYFDFKKAFDSIDHRLLLHKLSKLGFSSNIVSWIANYLSNRSQCVLIGETLSTSSSVTSGVPQGSCIGPLLFILFVNDLSKSLPSQIKYGIYADDLKIYARVPLHSHLLQSAIDSVFTWSQEWNLSLNESKCTVVNFGSLSPRTQYFINGTPLSVSPSIKDLGVLMQSSLKFTDHISKITCKARAKINLLFKCFFSTDPALYCRAFTTFIRPLLEYGSVIWSPHTVTLANQLEAVQRNFSRRLFARCFLPYALYLDRIAQLSLQTLEHRRFIFDLLFLHKSVHGFYCYDHSNLFRVAPLNRNLRGSHALRITLPFVPPMSHSSFPTRVIDRWNALSAESVTSSPPLFRSHILSIASVSLSPQSLLRL